ncbi:MAG: arginine--tRNA ligase [Alphaproteobacteria bacterium]|nr:arginine--tRNA ligase [Alphaproteobacteria bacterium]
MTAPATGDGPLPAVRRHIEEAVRRIVSTSAAPDGDWEQLLQRAVTLSPPRDPAHGDLATNASLVLAKRVGMDPRAFAGRLADALPGVAGIMSAEPAGPGFVNLRIAPSAWIPALREAVAAGADYGRSAMGGAIPVNVEFVSANPTGPLHVGHGRGAVLGDAMAALLAFAGFDVTREYYINDAGGQIDQLARSIHHRYRMAAGVEDSSPGEGLYPGEYLAPVAEGELAADGGEAVAAAEDAWLERFREAGIREMMKLIDRDLERLGIRFDVFVSERDLRDAGRVDKAVAVLKRRDLVYTGVPPRPKGAAEETWEPRPQLLFRASRFGDDADRPLRRANGEWTYFAGDLAYHFDKYRRGFRQQIDVWGADHGGYAKRVRAGLSALSEDAAGLDVKFCQLVRVTRAGQPVRMSKRDGNIVTLESVLREVGPDVFRFLMLMRRPDAPLDFDLLEAVRQSKDNPVYYVQYAHARICSVFRRVEEHGELQGLDVHAESDPTILADPREVALMREVALWPEQVEAAARAREPHRIAFQLSELAARYHALWTAGARGEPSLRTLLPGDRPRTAARLLLADAVRAVLRAGLSILGVTPAEEMR